MSEACKLSGVGNTQNVRRHNSLVFKHFFGGSMDNLTRLIVNLKKPSYVQDDCDGYMILKFCHTEERMNDFVSGKFFMNTLGFFSNLESTQLTNGQKDDFEGTKVYWKDNGKYFNAFNYASSQFEHYDSEPENQDNLVRIYNAQLGRGENIEKKIYCLYTIWVNTGEDKRTPINKSIMEDFGNYCAVVTNINEFYRRIGIAIKSSNFEWKETPIIGFVDYIDQNTSDGVVHIGPFRKFDNHIAEQEMRLCFSIDGINGPLNFFEVGDLSDIVSCFRTEDILD